LQDLVQEAYSRAWERWRKVRTYDEPEAWLRVVVNRLATDRWRKLAVRRDHAARQAPPDPATPPSEDLVYLTSGLNRLPADQRRALVLHYLLDMPLDQIAEEMSANLNTVKSWLSRGRAHLAVALSDTGGARVH